MLENPDRPLKEAALENPDRPLKEAATIAGYSDPRREGSKLMSVPAIRAAVDAERRRRSEEFRAHYAARRKRIADAIIKQCQPNWPRRRKRWNRP